MSETLLTKSKFKKALTCPTKLFYAHHAYPDSGKIDPFLQALAEGGIQVGELAKRHFAGGLEIFEENPNDAAEITERLLHESKDQVLFEAAFKLGLRMARIDVFRRIGPEVHVIEVKAKSIDEKKPLIVSGPKVGANWFDYVADLAFQRQLVEDWYRARGESVEVKGYLMVMDKEQVAKVDGLNKQFRLVKDGKCGVKCVVDVGEMGQSLMKLLDATPAIEALEYDPVFTEDGLYGVDGFSAYVAQCEQDVRQYGDGASPRYTALGKRCKECEFSTGREECMLQTGFEKRDLNRQMAWDIWNFKHTEAAFATGKYFLDQVQEEDLGSGANANRQWTQIKGTKRTEEQVDVEGLARSIAALHPPYHFIDFETTAPAIPHFSGLRPYEGMCFQYSHHMVDAEGNITHASQFLETGSEIDPSFAFIESLYDALIEAEGTIFRYATHENTYLNLVWEKLNARSPFTEKRTHELKAFIEDIAHEKGRPKVRSWSSRRDMVDLQVLVQNHYWHPRMKGSNSIKDVLPAVLESSQLLQAKYAQPIYGSQAMPSKNLAKGKVWIQRDPETRELRNPYELLPKISELLPANFDELHRIFEDEKIGNGGAAMNAWAFMQHQEMTTKEREALKRSLLEYCELDTLAMVFIWERFKELVDSHK